MTQSQGYDIYYKINSASPQLYKGPVTLTQSALLTAYASAMIDGKKVLSKELTASYTKCSESEDLIANSCVEHEDPSMATPIATPIEPEFTKSVDVSLISPEGGDIFYSLDGDDWILYSGAITLTESATIYTYADSDFSDIDDGTDDDADGTDDDADGTSTGTDDVIL